MQEVGEEMTALAIVLPIVIAIGITLVLWACVAINRENDDR